MNNVVPEGWRAYNLGELASKIEGGGTPSRTEPKFWNGALPWATVKDLKGIRLQSTLESISLNGLKQSASKLVPANTMILASRMAVGKAVVFDREVAINQDLKAFYPKPILESEYLLQWYLSKAEVIAHMGTGSTVKGIKLDDINSLPIDLPPLPEQKKIAAILTSVDDVIEKTQAQIDKLKDLKTGMMQELLTRGVGVDGKPHTEFKDSPVGRIPKGWEVRRLDSLATVVDSMHKTPRFTESGKPMVRVTEIRQSEVLNISGAMNVDKDTFDTFSKNYRPRFGDTLIARVGAYFGATSYIGDTKEFCLGQNTASIRPVHIDSNYLFIYLNSQIIRQQMDDAVAVGAQPSLSLKAIKELSIALPSTDEQELIAKSICSVRNKVDALVNKLNQQKHLKKALMQDLLTGKVRVKVES
ncbi:restriction endonuclease subunit S [Vibrio sp. SCSIO 43086]|uniref:restriction endonuclease subunit S n=1 Tax=Vibrio sp. SCSIO 43086 TaxID=2822845 RepID=UPI003DAA0825